MCRMLMLHVYTQCTNAVLKHVNLDDPKERANIHSLAEKMPPTRRESLLIKTKKWPTQTKFRQYMRSQSVPTCLTAKNFRSIYIYIYSSGYLKSISSCHIWVPLTQCDNAKMMIDTATELPALKLYSELKQPIYQDIRLHIKNSATKHLRHYCIRPLCKSCGTWSSKLTKPTKLQRFFWQSLYLSTIPNAE